jgi:hypothetical protein
MSFARRPFKPTRDHDDLTVPWAGSSNLQEDESMLYV